MRIIQLKPINADPWETAHQPPNLLSFLDGTASVAEKGNSEYGTGFYKAFRICTAQHFGLKCEGYKINDTH